MIIQYIHIFKKHKMMIGYWNAYGCFEITVIKRSSGNFSFILLYVCIHIPRNWHTIGCTNHDPRYESNTNPCRWRQLFLSFDGWKDPWSCCDRLRGCITSFTSCCANKSKTEKVEQWHLMASPWSFHSSTIATQHLRNTLPLRPQRRQCRACK